MPHQHSDHTQFAHDCSASLPLSNGIISPTILALSKATGQMLVADFPKTSYVGANVHHEFVIVAARTAKTVGNISVGYDTRADAVQIVLEWGVGNICDRTVITGKISDQGDLARANLAHEMAIAASPIGYLKPVAG